MNRNCDFCHETINWAQDLLKQIGYLGDKVRELEATVMQRDALIDLLDRPTHSDNKEPESA